jgi:hypothetical protein
MSTTQKQSQNGTSTKPVETATNGKKVETTVPVVKLPVKEEKPTLPFEDRLHKLNMLFDLQKKYLTLKNSQQKLLEFQMKSGDEDGCYLTIRDDNRNEFTTYNTSVIIEVLECLKNSINTKIKQIEPKLNW